MTRQACQIRWAQSCLSNAEVLFFFEPVTSSLVKPPGIHWNCGIFEARELPSGFVLTQIYPQMGVRSFVLEDAFLRI